MTRIYTAVDSCGNESTLEQILDVLDNENPVILAEEVFVDCDDYDATALYPLTIKDCALGSWTEEMDGTWAFEENDNWSTIYDDINSPVEVEWTDSTPELGEGTCYVVTRTVKATDNCGNSTTLEYPINITDTTAPEITATPVLNIECSAYLGDSFQGEDVVSYAVTMPSGSGLGSVIEISDPSNDWFGQTAFQVEDDCSFNELFAAGGGAVTVTWADTLTSDASCAGGVYARTYTATDACGNVATASQTIIIVDNTAPTWNEGFYTELVSCEEATEALMHDPNHLAIARSDGQLRHGPRLQSLCRVDQRRMHWFLAPDLDSHGRLRPELYIRADRHDVRQHRSSLGHLPRGRHLVRQQLL